MYFRPQRRRGAARVLAVTAAGALLAGSFTACSTTGAGQAQGDITINVALAANPQMKTAESLISDFEQKNPGIKVKFTTLPENDLRPTVTKDVATKAGQFDVAMMGSYEVPIWAKNNWILPLDSYATKDASWKKDDLLKPIQDIVSADGKLYAAPFYGSSSFLFYRKDLAQKAGVTISQTPTWEEIAAAAAKMDDKSKGLSGICLRGLPGWGQNLASLTTVINTFGGRWFDENWKPQLNSPETEKAVQFYVDLLRQHGQADAAKDGWEGCLQKMSQGSTAMWYDDTVFAGSVLSQATPEVKANLGFAMAPTGPAGISSGWLWSWGLGITSSSKNPEAAWKFISWVTSPDYIKLAGQKAGWDSIPPGSRNSTYDLPEYKQAASQYADLTLKSIKAANPTQPTKDKVPYTGVQYVQIPEFVDIGDFVSQQVAGAISGTQSVGDALQKSQDYATNAVKTAGYLK